MQIQVFKIEFEFPLGDAGYIEQIIDKAGLLLNVLADHHESITVIPTVDFLSAPLRRKP